MKVLTLTIELDERTKTFNAELDHHCDSSEHAIQLIQDYIDRRKKKVMN